MTWPCCLTRPASRPAYVLRVGAELVDGHFEDVLGPVIGVRLVQLFQLQPDIHQSRVHCRAGKGHA